MPKGAGLATEFADADDSPGLLLWRVTQRWQSAMRAAVAPHDLTHVQFVLLASLTWMHSETPVTQADLAAHAGTDPMMTSQVVRALIDKGLVSRLPHPTDGRAFSLAATPAGAQAANAAVVDVEAADRKFFGSLGRGVPRFARDLAVLSKQSLVER